MTSPNPIRPMVATFLGGLLGAVVIGIVTNFINARVSPAYFVGAMGWDGDISSMAITQGIFEGGVIGAVLGGITATVFTVRTRGHGTTKQALLLVGALLGLAVIDWLVGGLLGLLAGALGGDWFSTRFGVQRSADILRVAWVGGSIQGAELGAIVTTLLGLVVFWLRNGKALVQE